MTTPHFRKYIGKLKSSRKYILILMAFLFLLTYILKKYFVGIQSVKHRKKKVDSSLIIVILEHEPSPHTFTPHPNPLLQLQHPLLSSHSPHSHPKSHILLSCYLFFFIIIAVVYSYHILSVITY